jgi:hypothetical protein
VDQGTGQNGGEHGEQELVLRVPVVDYNHDFPKKHFVLLDQMIIELLAVDHTRIVNCLSHFSVLLVKLT